MHDFRGFEHLGEGLGWRQQTREREAARLEQEAADAAANLAKDEAKERAMGRQLRKRLKTSSTVGKKSGRPWKNPGSRAAGQKVDFGKKQERKAAWDAKMKRRAEDEAWKAWETTSPPPWPGLAGGAGPPPPPGSPRPPPARPAEGDPPAVRRGTGSGRGSASLSQGKGGRPLRVACPADRARGTSRRRRRRAAD